MNSVHPFTSSTAPGKDDRLELTEFINDGFNGVLLRPPSKAWGETYAQQKQFITEMNEAGLWTATSPYTAQTIEATKKQTAKQVAMGVDWIELDEPFGINSNGCYPLGWLTSEANYQSLKSTLPSNVPLVVTDVHCNSKIWNWNIDALMQEVYGTNMYPAYMNNVVSWSWVTKKPGYVFINAYNRQLYNSCLEQTESMFQTWTKAAWDNGLKIVLFSFSNRCSDCITNSDCSAGGGYGNDWPMVQQVVRGITAGTRVKFHEWDGFKVSSTQVAKPTVSVNVRSSQAGLSPSSVKCYYTTNYKGAYDQTPRISRRDRMDPDPLHQ